MPSIRSLRSVPARFVLAAALAVAAVGACGGDDDDAPPPAPSPEAGADAPNGPQRAPFGLDARPANPTCKPPARPPSTAPVKLERVFDNVDLSLPMMMAQIPGDGSRWFVAQRGTTNGGTADIVSFPVASPPDTPSVVASIGPLGGLNGEGGLLGLAFHPKFAQNGRLYVSWTRSGGPAGLRSEVGYLTSTDGGATFGGYTTVLGPFDQPYTNHNGGGIAFGKDGYLYLSFGDGGAGDDAAKHGQNKDGFFSKVLRIDVDDVPAGAPADRQFGIPAGNPFAASGGEPATFAMGFRNPFRFSVDRETGKLWVGDVGQGQWEEIDAKIQIGKNYGWPCREGLHDHITTADDATKCPSMSVGFVDPIVEHDHGEARSITGGVVYRGEAIPAFVGSYIYGDYVTQALWTLSFDPKTGDATSTKLEGAPAANWVSFAEDQDGEIYAVALNQGEIYKVLPAEPPAPSTFPETLSKTGCVDPAHPTEPAPGLIPYTVNSPLWSDGAVKARYMALPDGATVAITPEGDFDFPVGTVLMKTFSLGGRPIETRLFMRHDDGDWGGYTYEWRDDGSDAVLLPSSKAKPVGAQTWYFPSRSECMACHSEAAGRSLGPEVGQLNGDFVYASTNRIANQLATLEHIGVFASPLGGPPAGLAAYPDPQKDGPLEGRARAYLHANCSNCHRPRGPGRGDMDLRFATPLADTHTCDADPEAGDLGIAGAKLLAPAHPERSLLWVRPSSPAQNRMPPLASSVVDGAGMKVLGDFIRQLAACP